MAIPLYLAMTAAEFRRAATLPRYAAWLSCLFSPYSTGLSNIPKQLPQGSLLILSDRTPVCGHDPGLIKGQLEEAVSKLHCSGVLLDLQRPGCKATASIVQALITLPCPVAVSEAYAQDRNCPIFLPPVPPDIPLEEYFAPWEGREKWLEMALDAVTIRVTEKGTYREVVPPVSDCSGRFQDDTLCCHYDIAVSDAVRFTLQRTKEDLEKLLAQADHLGITKAVGLYQELG